MTAEHLNILVGDKRVCIPDLDNTDETFMAAVERLATSAAKSTDQAVQQAELLVVTHREGLWELMAAAGLAAPPYMPPYACICQFLFVPRVVNTPSTELSEVSKVAETTSVGGWYVAHAGFDVGYRLDLDKLSPWRCSRCTGSQLLAAVALAESKHHRIWGAGRSSVCCDTCGQQRPWFCRMRNDEIPVDAFSTR
jgi:hypothetical protein